MSDLTNNNYCENNIDKFDGLFEQEEMGCTIVINETINSITNLAASGLYVYLLCRPKNWKINIKHLTQLFNCSKTKIYNLIDHLISLNLLTRTEYRQKGKFLEYKYRLFIRPRKVQIVQVTPVPKKPDAVNCDAYKTKKLKNKEDIKTTNCETPSSSNFFSEKQTKQLLELKLPTDERTSELFLEHCQHHIQKQKNDLVTNQRIKGLKTILEGLVETGQHFQSSGFEKSIPTKTETDEERNERQFFEYELIKEREREGYISKALEQFPQMRVKYA